jgi:hypothetical protein
MNQLLQHVKEELAVVKEKNERNKNVKKDDTNSNLATFQELYELAQRKFLRQLIQFSDSESFKIFPRLIFIDFYEKEKIEAIVRSKQIKTSERIDEDNEKEETVQKDAVVNNEINLIGNFDSILKLISTTPGTLIPGLRILCEHEEGWHKAKCFIPINDIQSFFSPYLSRIMSLLKK